MLKRTAIALLLAWSATGAQAQVANATKQNLTIDDPVAQQMWADVIPSLQGVGLAYPPVVQLITTKDRFGRTLAYSMLQSGMTCGASDCRARLFVDGKMINDGQGCGEFDYVNFAIDGTYVDACDAHLNVPPPAVQ